MTAAPVAKSTNFRPENERTIELLIAIEDWIVEVGVVDFSLRAAAKAASVSAPTLLRHFGSREGLLEALIEHRTSDNVDTLQAEVDAAGSFSALLAGAMEEAFEINLRETQLNIHLRGLAQTIGGALAAQQMEIRERGTAAIAAHIAREGVKPKQAQKIAHFLVSASTGHAEAYALHRDGAALTDDYRLLYRSILTLIEDAKS